MRRLLSVATILGLVLSLGLVGCSGSNRITHSTPKQAYEKGMAQYEEGDYDKAIRYFQAVFNYSRGNEWAPDAQFQLAMAQRKKGKHIVAANEFKRFRQFYRNDPRVPRALYEQGRAHYAQSPRYNLDQKHTRRAISLFQLYIDRYPDHELVSEAEERVNELRAKLARKKYEAAKLYERRRMWRAATETYKGVFDQYADTPWADDALLGTVRSYVRYADRSVERKQAERYQQAIDYFSRLQQLFPDSPLIEQATPFRDEAERKLERVRAQQQESPSIAQDGESPDSTR